MTLGHAFEKQLQILALTLRPGTLAQYRYRCNAFLTYLRTAYPEVRHLRQLRRTPHITDWLRSLHQRRPPLAATSRAHCIIQVRRVLTDLDPSRTLFLRGDVPPEDIGLPKPLSPEDDLLLQEQLLNDDDLRSNAFLLMRLTGLRIGEGRSLRTDSLQHLGGSDWALRVPLGKLHNERWVPLDQRGCEIFARLLELRTAAHDGGTSGWLITAEKGQVPCYASMRHALTLSAQRAGCSGHITPHRLRHTFATTMLRAGVSLLAIKEMLGHRSLKMTMRYVQVTQVDLQREYYTARQKMAALYPTPVINLPKPRLDAIQSIIGEASHLIEMLRRDLIDKPDRARLRRLTERLGKISLELTKLPRAPK